MRIEKEFLGKLSKHHVADVDLTSCFSTFRPPINVQGSLSLSALERFDRP